MRTATQQNSKLKRLMYNITDDIMTFIQQQPGGYAFIHTLPAQGRHCKAVIRKRIVNLLLASTFSEHFITLLLQSALTAQGKPTSQLYNWLLAYIYAGDTQALYSDWLTVKDRCNDP